MPRRRVKGLESDIEDFIDVEEHLAHEEAHKLHVLWGLSRKDFREIFSAEVLAVSGGVAAGAALALFFNRVEVLPALLIVLPGFLEMRGAVGGSMSARLSSALFLGALKPKINNQRILRGNVIASFFLSIFVALVLGLVAYSVELFLFGVQFIEIVWIMLLAGALSTLIELPLTVATTFYLFRKGVDPDNVMGPYITTLGDVVSVASILIAAGVVL